MVKNWFLFKLNNFRNWLLPWQACPPKNFKEWILSEEPNLPIPQSFSYKELYDKVLKLNFDRQYQELEIKKFYEDLVEKASKGPVNLAINLDEGHDHNHVIDFNQFCSFKNVNEFDKSTPPNFLSISKVNGHNLTVKRAIIKDVSFSRRGKVIFENCLIKKLVIAHKACIDLFLNECLVGEIVINSGSVKNFEIHRGWICSVDCPTQDKENPFLGSVILSNVQFSYLKSPSLISGGPQQYRNMRAHLESLQNVPAANLMRAKELATEYESEHGLNKWFNGFYGISSNYGLNPGRPWIWLALLFFIMFAFLFARCEGKLGQELKFYKDKGWRSGLLKQDHWGRASRAFLLQLQTMANPFGIAGRHNLVVPNSFGIKILLFLFGLLADGLIILSVFCIRKRFKIH